ncbi:MULTISPECIES: hypothetical protein [unclassified Methanoculleus]|jgi:hypothetical protein|uniref:Uncharacterized protein n=1 Tax=Methanoculleus palmolei TaxID=72612 RepID=A0ABD8A9J4_9EURY|nr:hypothetical protein R6Y95_02155 [Methanoculleus palmolei]
MPTKTVVERKKAATPKTKRSLTPAERAERKAGLARLEADMEEARKSGFSPLAEVEKRLGL